MSDVVVGALKLDSYYSGAAYVVYGHLLISSMVPELNTSATAFTGSKYSGVGYTVSSAGDTMCKHM
jgi:hypothetical protein